MATYLHAAEMGQVRVKMSAQDIRDFVTLVRKDPKGLPPFTTPANIAPDVKTRVEADVAKMKDIFKGEDLIASSEILLTLASELKFDPKELYFVPDGADVAWLLSYVAEHRDQQK
jgi:hypothetical protein